MRAWLSGAGAAAGDCLTDGVQWKDLTIVTSRADEGRCRFVVTKGAVALTECGTLGAPARSALPSDGPRRTAANMMCEWKRGQIVVTAKKYNDPLMTPGRRKQKHGMNCSEVVGLLPIISLKN